MEEYKLDNLDRQILKKLQEDARQSFQEIARELIVSGGTIHVRYNNMKNAGIIKGTTLKLDREKLGFDICAFVGLNLHNAKDYSIVIKKLQKMPEVVEAHFTTGKYNIFIKILAKSTRGLYDFLIERVQEITEIQSTETLISLEIPIAHSLPVANESKIK
jgi:Lrp/AsnC family transcriptional regulator for asnA, asnC and gidA